MSSEKGTEDEGKVVWLVNKGGHDYSKLTHWGRVVPLTSGSVSAFNPDRLMVNLGHHISMARQHDYLAISGLPIANALAIAMWLRRFPDVHILQHSVRQDNYVYLHVTNVALEQNLKGD